MAEVDEQADEIEKSLAGANSHAEKEEESHSDGEDEEDSEADADNIVSEDEKSRHLCAGDFSDDQASTEDSEEEVLSEPALRRGDRVRAVSTRLSDMEL